MCRKLKSIFGIIMLVMLLCSVVGITAFANKVVNEEPSLVKGVSKASSSEVAPPEEESSEEAEEDKKQDNTVTEETEETMLMENRSAKAVDSDADYIPVEGVAWGVGEHSFDGKDYPGWAIWDSEQLNDEEWSRVRFVSINVFKDGEYVGGGEYDGDEKQIDADLRYHFKEAGTYTFKATYVMNDSEYDPDPEDDALWSDFSDEYEYTLLNKKVDTPTGLKWNSDGTIEWKGVSGNESYSGAKMYVPELYRKNTETGEYECISSGGLERGTSTKRFIRRMQAGETYKFKVVALGDLITYSNSDASAFSEEFVMNMTSEEGKRLIEDLGSGDVKNNIENASLSTVEKGGLKLAIQADPEVSQNYAKLEEVYKNSASKAALEIGTGESGVDKSKVNVIGGVLNGATGIKFDKPTQEDLDKAGVTNYRKWSAVNISLDGENLSGELKFPVLITMAVPNGMSAREMTIMHIKHDGTIETMRPRDNKDGTVSFAVTEFSSFLFVDNTPTSGGSTGGGKGSSGGGGSSAKGDPLETSGAWIQNEMGWQFARLDGKATASQWLMNGGNWFRFDENSYMITGWFTDADGRKFYLNPISDGFKGVMKTGWQMIEGKWYYFNPVSDGTKGALSVNTTTPDGYAVNADGVWLQ